MTNGIDIGGVCRPVKAAVHDEVFRYVEARVCGGTPADHHGYCDIAIANASASTSATADEAESGFDVCVWCWWLVRFRCLLMLFVANVSVVSP